MYAGGWAGDKRNGEGTDDAIAVGTVTYKDGTVVRATYKDDAQVKVLEIRRSDDKRDS